MGCASSSATLYDEDDYIPGYKSVNKTQKTHVPNLNSYRINSYNDLNDIPGGYRIIENKRNTR